MAINVEEAVKDWVSSPPIVYLKLKKTLEDPRSSFKEFSEVIGGDPALVARLLKIVNSSFYGFETEIETVTHALNIVGTEQLTELVLATTVIREFKDIPKRIVDMLSFWRHSIACGVAAKIIAEAAGESHLESYYIAGMLHDIGSLVIYKKFPDKATEVLERCRSHKENLLKVELEVFGASHAKVGCQLLKGWGLPGRIYEPVFCHHRPKESKDHPMLTRIVHLADSIVDEIKLGSSGEPLANPVDPKIYEELGYDEFPAGQLEKLIRDQFFDAIKVFT